MKLETTLWDSAELLDSREAIAAYIEAAFEDGDPSLITHALGVVARAKGMSQLAREAGVTREALYKALTPNGDPKLSTFLGVLKALGMKLSARAA
jgi:probable addiction module antidote protein